MEQGTASGSNLGNPEVNPVTAGGMTLFARHASDVIHAGLVVFICTSATVYALVAHDHSDNIWIVYGSAIAFAAGRAGVSATRMFRETDTKI